VDVNDLRIAVTVSGLVLFVAMVLHTWSGRRRAEHADAAALPFTGDEPAQPQQAVQGERGE
jgi:hypothetical protein